MITKAAALAVLLATPWLWLSVEDQDPPRPGLDAQTIERASGAKATIADDGVVRIAWSRTDVPVTVDGMKFPASAGLGSWAAFKAMPGGEGSAMLMGDTVVFEDEITPAMDAAFAAGLEVTALHNHFTFDRPPVYFMHIGGMGQPQDLAAGVKGVWDAIRNVRGEHPQPSERFGGPIPEHKGGLDADELQRVVGQGTATTSDDGVVKVTIGREARMHGLSFGASMGLTTWAAFSGSPELAAVDGDFAMTAGEVQPVMRALRQANIHIVALHNHMIAEEPGYYFLHYWGTGNVKDLAQGVRSALDAQKQTPASGH